MKARDVDTTAREIVWVRGGCRECFGRELTGATREMRDWEQVILGKAQAGQKHRVLRSQDQGTIRD